MKTMLGFNLPHPPYTPDLLPRDYCLFADLKKMLQGQRFDTNGEVIAEAEACFEDDLLNDVLYLNNFIMLFW